MHKTYGWRPDRPDFRDHLFSHAGIACPPAVDLRALCPAVLDQGQLGSCTGNAIANAHHFEQMRQQMANAFAPSRLFIYYNERALEGTIKSDAGAAIRDGIKTIAKQGVCAETLWPYNISRFTRKPAVRAYKAALAARALKYQRVTQATSAMRACLAAGRPFVFGFTVYESFESAEVAQSGVVPMPQPHERALGGHAVLCVGYDDASERFIVMNSWGTGWGQAGFFTIPYAYLSNRQLASDFWMIELVA